MPNWCENDLFVTDEKSRVREFLEFAKSENSVFDFDRLIPHPAKFEELDRTAVEWKRRNGPGSREKGPKDGFNSGGYDWCWEHWGTKWNAQQVIYGNNSIDGSTATAVVHFETAWSPPLPVVFTASEQFPSIDFDLRYFERGACFQGRYHCRGGEVIVSYRVDYFGPRGG